MNILRTQVESYVGAGFVVMFAGFCASMLFIMVRNFNSDVEILSAQQTQIRTISPSQRLLMDTWVRENSIQIPEGEGYRWLLNEYPSRPWQ
jgi:hypothetical protein